jgi:hypothetical protein
MFRATVNIGRQFLFLFGGSLVSVILLLFNFLLTLLSFDFALPFIGVFFIVLSVQHARFIYGFGFEDILKLHEIFSLSF